MDLEQELDQLYQVEAGAFVAERNRLAKTLRAAGRREEAERVAKLPRPSPVAWVVNQLHFQASGELGELRAAGRALREAQEGLAAAGEFAIRKRAEREALDRTVSRALSLAGADAKTNAGLRRKLELTLGLLAAAPEGGPDRPGRMSVELEPLGFDALGLSAAPIPRSPAGEPEGDEAEHAAKLASARAARGAAEREVRRLEAEVERKKARADRAASDAENAERLAEAARRERDEAVREEREERERLSAARAEVDERTKALATLKE